MGQGRSVVAHLNGERCYSQSGSYAMKNPLFEEAHVFQNKLRKRTHQPHLNDRSAVIIEVRVVQTKSQEIYTCFIV